MHVQKTLRLLLILSLFSSKAFAFLLEDPSHNLALRMGGAIDKNIGVIHNSGLNQQFSQMRGSFLVGVVYDFFLYPFLSLSPELHYHTARNTKFSLDNNTYKASWQELSLGIQLKVGIGNLVYMGFGPGVSFAFQPKASNLDLQSSVYPYIVAEVGSNLPLIELNDTTHTNVHFALRYTNNIINWKDQSKAGSFQNDWSVSLLLGLSLLFGEPTWSSY
jgi:hypothetical protein